MMIFLRQIFCRHVWQDILYTRAAWDNRRRFYGEPYPPTRICALCDKTDNSRATNPAKW